MEQFLIIALVISISFNGLSWILLFKLFSDTLESPAKKQNRQVKMIKEMSTPIAPDDHVDMRELSDEDMRKAITKTLNGVAPEDDEAPDLYQNI